MATKSVIEVTPRPYTETAIRVILDKMAANG